MAAWDSSSSCYFEMGKVSWRGRCTCKGILSGVSKPCRAPLLLRESKYVFREVKLL